MKILHSNRKARPEGTKNNIDWLYFFHDPPIYEIHNDIIPMPFNAIFHSSMKSIFQVKIWKKFSYI